MAHRHAMSGYLPFNNFRNNYTYLLITIIALCASTPDAASDMAKTVATIVPETEWPSEAPLQLMQSFSWKPEPKASGATKDLSDSEGALSSAKAHKLEAKGPRSDPKGAVDWVKNIDKELVPPGADVKLPSTKSKKKTKGPTVTPKML